MTEPDPQPSKAEQRQLAVEKLRRAASLPRMKDGRRPPMHVEAVSEGEKASPGTPDEKKSPSASPPPDVTPPQEPADPPEPEPEPEQEVADPEPEADIEERTASPGPASRSKRRSRSRSRSRGSRDFKSKARNAQSPILPSTAGDSSQDDEEPPVPIPLPIALPVVPLLSPIPSHLAALQNSRFLRSPTPDPSMFYPGTSPPTPIPLPTLEALQRGLFRSNSANSPAAGRRQALAKLTGVADTYEPSPSPTPPPFHGKLSRNNTVSGGERIAARQMLLTRLNGRLAKEAEAEASGSEERGAPSPTPRRRRRRSRRGSLSAAVANAGISDSETGNTSTDTPVPPNPPQPHGFETFIELRAQSTTPIQASNVNQSYERVAEVPPGMMDTADAVNSKPFESARRRSVLVEEDEEDEGDKQQQQHTAQLRYEGLPSTPPRIPPHIAITRAPHSSDAPSQASTDSGITSGAVGVPFFLSQQAPSRSDLFPTSPFTTPLKEKPSEEEEEQVLYHHDTYRARTPYSTAPYSANNTDADGREISWVGEPVPIIIESDIDDDADDDDMPPPEEKEPEGDGAFEEEELPLSPTSSQHETTQHDVSSSPQISSQSLVVESEFSPERRPTQASSSPSSVAALSSQSPDESRMSPQSYPTRLSAASRIQSGDKSPLIGDEWEEQSSSTKRNGDTNSPQSTWEKVKNTFARAGSSGRRSRSNSIAARERRDNVDSSVSRESGASLTNTKLDKAGEGLGQQLQAPPLMQTPSASASILSLSPHTHVPPRSGPSPIPPATSADLARYQNAKLFPFPGIQKLEEMQRNRTRATGMGGASLSTPDIIGASSMGDEDQPPLSASSFNTTPGHTPEMTRERKLSHQASDTRLLSKFNSGSPGNGVPVSPSLMMTPSNMHTEYIDVIPSPSSQNGKVSKLPMTLPGVKQWLSKNNRKLFSSPSSSSTPQTSSSSVPTVASVGTDSDFGSSSNTERSKNGNKKPSLSDLLKRRGSELGADWEDIGPMPVSANGDYPYLSSQPSTLASTIATVTKATPSSSSSDSNDKSRVLIPKAPGNGVGKAGTHPDTEKTPKAKKVTPLDLHKSTYLHVDESPSPLSNLPSRSDPLLSSTPDPSSSLSDYPLRSTSQSSSNSSQYSIIPQGSVVIDRLDENLARGSRNPFLASVIDDPPRKSVFTWPVLQVVNQRTVKDRFLFLFNDLLVIAKPVFSPHENLVDFKPSPPDRKYIVKNVVLLKDIRFRPERVDTTSKGLSQSPPAKNSVIKAFVTQYAKDPEAAVRSLLLRSKLLEDATKLGQFLFRTVELDRARMGDYLARRAHKAELKAYLDSFGFVGVRVDKALRVFLLSVNVPLLNSGALDYLLDVFASRWYDANARFVAYDRDMAIRVVRALVRLNKLLHGDVAQDPGPTGYPLEDVPCKDFVEHLRRGDPRYLIPDELLEDLYDSIRRERLCQARCPSDGDTPDITIVVRRPVPSWLTYKIQSEPIVLRIPQPDPQFTIHLEGQDLQFEPSVLNFAKSSEVSFRVMGTSLGSKTMIMCRSGPNAVRYTGLPLSNTLVVERAFMRNTFQIAFTDHLTTKRRYMFSVDDPVWAVNLRRSIENASSASASVPTTSLEAAKFLKVAEQVAFKVLQRALMEGPESIRTNGLTSIQNGHSLQMKYHMNGGSNGYRHPTHVRSKSRSKLYHHTVGQNELDLNYDTPGYNDHRESDFSDVTMDTDQTEQYSGPLWSAGELVAQCQQNSTIPLVLSLLQIGAFSKDASPS